MKDGKLTIVNLEPENGRQVAIIRKTVAFGIAPQQPPAVELRDYLDLPAEYVATSASKRN